MDAFLDKLRLYRLPFWVKMFWAKCFIRMFRAFCPDDIILYIELSDWINTNGKPITSSPNYKKAKEAAEYQQKVKMN